jgi:hypothetical protein
MTLPEEVSQQPARFAHRVLEEESDAKLAIKAKW